MRVSVKGRLGRHSRSFTFPSHCGECAEADALRLARFYADHGQGVYGPSVWKFGTISIRTLGDVKPRVIREQRPELKLVQQ